MTGSPLLRLLVVLAALALLCAAVWRHTGTRTAPQGTRPAPPTAKVPQHVTLTFTSVIPPDTIRVEALGSLVADLARPASTAEISSELDLPAEGVDLVIHAIWSGPQPANALRIEAAAADEPLADITLWGEREIRDVVTLKGISSP